MSARNIISSADFIAAAGDGNMRAVREYVERGGDINATPRIYNNRTALFNAAYFNHRDILRYLLEHGADPTIYPVGGVFNGDSVLYQMIAHHTNDIDAVRTVLERGADPNRALELTGETPITSVRNPEILKLLLEHGGNPNDQPPHRMSKADDIAQHLEGISHRERPWPQWLKDTWNDNMKMFELLCEHGSTSESCVNYRGKKTLLEQKTLSSTGSTLPENITRNILQRGFSGGSKRKATRKGRKGKSRRKTTSSSRRR